MESVAIGDLNGEGKADLATAHPGVRFYVVSANCRVGTIRRAYSKVVRRDRVISQKPKFGTVRPGDSKVNLIVSRGRNP